MDVKKVACTSARGQFSMVKPSMAQLSLLTVVFAVQPRLYDVVELENKCAWCCEEPIVTAGVFNIRPDNPVSSGRFGGGGAPDLGRCWSAAAFEQL